MAVARSSAFTSLRKITEVITPAHHQPHLPHRPERLVLGPDNPRTHRRGDLNGLRPNPADTNLADTNPVTFADLSGQVDDYWDRGLLGLALPPNFPADPYVYVLYSYDAPIGGTAPAWNDGCPTPPGPTTDGCLISARVSRLQISGNVMTGSEQVLVNDWCQQFPSHSVGTLLFGRDGYLYVSGGDGASFNNVDYGQYGANYAGDRANPCGDPPGFARSPAKFAPYCP